MDVFFKRTGGYSSGKVQYKDAIWTHSEEQRKKADARAEKEGAAGRLDIEEAEPFYRAEEYHQKFHDKQAQRLGSRTLARQWWPS